MGLTPPLDVAGELKRIRKELGRRRRAPLRIIIASDPDRPVRTLVIPRALPTPSGQVGRFALELVNTGEQMEVTFDLATGEPDAPTYRRLRHFMRCQRTGAETPLDPRLVDLLYRLAQRTRQRIQ